MSLTARTIDVHACSKASSTHPEYPQFMSESERIKSYLDWPCALKQKPAQLAEAGFFYTGMNDSVKCFQCGGGLKHWTETDIPWEQHAIWYERCLYLKLIKGAKFINKMQAHKNFQSEDLQKGYDDDAEQKNDNRLCKICYETEFNTTFFPCGHILACEKCASSVTKCPYCRQCFTSVLRVYFP